MKVSIIKGDITQQKTDAIVNAADKSLLGGGGVDGAIHKKAGEKLLEECKKLREEKYPDCLPVGEAVFTKAYRLDAKFVIHTVGPVYGRDEIGLLRNCYKHCMQIAEELNCKSISFPAISTGAFGVPIDVSARIAKEFFEDYDSEKVREVVLVLYTEKDYEAYKQEFENQ